MSLAQSNLLKFCLRVDPTAKGSSATIAGQKFQGVGSGTTITGAANNGSGLIRITAASHGLVTGQYASIYGVSGVTAANSTAGNPAWLVTRIDANNVDLQSSTFAGTYSGSGATITGALVGSVDGTRFTRQRLLDMYNEARMILFTALYDTKPKDTLDRYVYGAAINANLTFSYSAPFSSASMPTGFIKLISLYAYNGYPVIVFPLNMFQEVQKGGVHFTTSATNLIGFHFGNYFRVIGSFASELGDGSLSHYATLTYYGITDLVWATDILTNTTYESFSLDVEPMLLEIACAIADEQSSADTLALAKTLLNRKEK